VGVVVIADLDIRPLPASATPVQGCLPAAIREAGGQPPGGNFMID